MKMMLIPSLSFGDTTPKSNYLGGQGFAWRPRLNRQGI